MVQGVNKEYIFYKEEYIEKYLDIIEQNKKDYNIDIIAFCMMNNHGHFLVYTENMNVFGKFMQKTNLQYAQMYNRKENRCGVLFRNRYQTEPIYDSKYLINCIKYIHNNPVKAKVVPKCEDYKYSSYNDYMKNTGVTKCKIVKEIFGKDCDFSKLFNESYDKRFMDIEEDDKENRNQYILEGIREFEKLFSYNTIDIFSNRLILRKLVVFLKEECKFKYVEIRDFLDISRGAMDVLKNRI